MNEAMFIVMLIGSLGVIGVVIVMTLHKIRKMDETLDWDAGEDYWRRCPDCGMFFSLSGRKYREPFGHVKGIRQCLGCFKKTTR